MNELHAPEAVLAIKSVMGYIDGTDVCKVCEFFAECDCSGNISAPPARCMRNAFWFQVSEGGTCKCFKKKEKK